MMNDKDHKTISPGNAVGAPPRNYERPSLTIDYDLYWHYLDNSDMPDEQKRELIEALWYLVVSFVDLGFGVHSAQLASRESCEQDGGLIPSKPASMVNCCHTTKTEFTASVHKDVTLAGEGSPE
ncbi:MAG: hypothetical protein GY761_16975 [Hyphomicrobiales bacterium]|nr:hypothetical protein [Hyphomicrobiales bacterium]